MVWVYAISSVGRNYIYVGMTKDVDARLARHNKGREKITKPDAPFQLIFTEVCANRVKAREREAQTVEETPAQARAAATNVTPLF